MIQIIRKTYMKINVKINGKNNLSMPSII